MEGVLADWWSNSGINMAKVRINATLLYSARAYCIHAKTIRFEMEQLASVGSNCSTLAPNSSHGELPVHGSRRKGNYWVEQEREESSVPSRF